MKPEISYIFLSVGILLLPTIMLAIKKPKVRGQMSYISTEKGNKNKGMRLNEREKKIKRTKKRKSL